MDHHGLLMTLRHVTAALSVKKAGLEGADKSWTWAHTVVMTPESHCPFCNEVVRSPDLWVLAGPRQEELKGLIRLRPGGKIEFVYPSHPHDMGGGHLCLKYNPDGISLLSSTPNISDAPMGTYYIPRWLKRYWNHTCRESRAYLNTHGHIAQLQELDKL